jgi:hypothetical protein
MTHADDKPDCVCPECLARCDDCVSVGVPLSVEQLRAKFVGGAPEFGREAAVPERDAEDSH